MAYTGPSEITSIAWSPQIPGMSMNTGQTTAPGEWMAVAMGRTIKALKV
jgi:DDB1- and CUL4-associated factor 7